MRCGHETAGQRLLSCLVPVSAVQLSGVEVEYLIAESWVRRAQKRSVSMRRLEQEKCVKCAFISYIPVEMRGGYCCCRRMLLRLFQPLDPRLRGHRDTLASAPAMPSQAPG